MASAIHDLVAVIAVMVVGGGVGWSAYLALRAKTGGTAFVRFQAVMVAVLIVAASSGAILLFTGASPAAGLHFLYAVIAIAIIPLTRSFYGHTHGRRRALLTLVAFLVLAAIVFRLYTSG